MSFDGQQSKKAAPGRRMSLPAGAAERDARRDAEHGATAEAALNRSSPAIAPHIASPEAIIAEAASGRMVILVDDEGRENEGDLVIPAQFATADVINFMARHGRGLICLALTEQRVQELRLPMMARSNRSRFDTAFTASIEAAHGITTGISAADRARTIAVAINPETRPDDLATPGHVFPIRARDGGTLIRAGHTEAAVDLARCAGLNPAGVICEIMNEDGSMARLGALVEFADGHHIKIGTIADLIAYRSRTERLVEQVAVSGLHHPAFGEWRLYVYRDIVEGAEHVVLAKGHLSGENSPVLVKLHVLNVFSDLLLRSDTLRGDMDPIASAMHAIMMEGRGVVVLLRDGRRDAVSAQVTTQSPHRRFDPQHRDFGIGAQILIDLDIRSVDLITMNRETFVGLEGYGLQIVGHRTIDLQ